MHLQSCCIFKFGLEIFSKSEINQILYWLLFYQVFKVRSKEDGCLYAVKKSRDKFRGDADR